MLSKLFSFVFMPVFTLIILWALGWLLFATYIAMDNINKDDIKTDAIIVLTGGNGRINEGLNLLNKKLSPKLFISGVNEDVTEDDIFKTWELSDLSLKRPCCITLGYKSTDTISNASEVKEWIVKNNIKSIRLVTSSYHMPRAVMEIRNRLPQTEIIQHPVISNEFQLWDEKFWQLTFSEYNKTLIRLMKNITL